MKARVTAFLNLRTGTPEILPDNNTGDKFYSPGDTIDIIEKVIGESYKDNNIWYRLADGGFVWSGGVDFHFGQSDTFSWWLQNPLFSIPSLWSETTKQDIKVAILDTGISNHVDFDFSKINGFNYLTNSNNFQIDINGHGTHCAGIIIAKGGNSFGIAPETRLFVAKVCDDFGIPNIGAIKNALSDIFLDRNGADNVRIINMSFGIIVKNAAEEQIRKDIQILLKKIAEEKNCLLIASSGSIEDRKDSFPSLLPECISVGCLNSNFLRHELSRKTITLDIMAPGQDIISSKGSNDSKKETGTSQAAAFISGVCSLLLQKIDAANLNTETFRKILFATAFSNSFPVDEYGHGIIDANNLFDVIKNKL